jgi:lambda repressor-like predicted transcriptional regulator
MDMKQAYDLKELLAELKSNGLELAEDSAELVYASLKSWLKKSAAKSSTPIDDMVLNFLDKLDPVVLPAIDKINPDDNVQ